MTLAERLLGAAVQDVWPARRRPRSHVADGVAGQAQQLGLFDEENR